MSPAPLHPRTLRALPLGEHRDSVRPGLVLRVTAGARSFFVAYKVRGAGGWQTRRYRLGSADELTLAEAREQARAILALVAQGRDPHAERLEERRRPSGLTVGDLAERMLAALPLAPKTLDGWTRMLAVDVAPLAGRPAQAVTRAEIRALVAAIVDRGAPVLANRVLQFLRRVYTWGQEQDDLVPGWPGAGLRASAEAPRDRVLTAEEVGALWRALHGWLEGPFRDASLLLLLTGVRRDCVLGMRRDEVDLEAGLWRIPAERMKADRAHVVPLVGPALELVRGLLAAAPGACLLRQARRDAPRTWPTKTMTLLRAMVGAEVAAGRGLELPIVEGGAVDAAAARAVVPAWTIHDLRRTVATHMREDLRVGRDVVAAILAHRVPGVTGIYDRSELLDERRAALVAWAAWCERQAAPRGAVVLPMAR